MNMKVSYSTENINYTDSELKIKEWNSTPWSCGGAKYSYPSLLFSGWEGIAGHRTLAHFGPSDRRDRTSVLRFFTSQNLFPELNCSPCNAMRLFTRTVVQVVNNLSLQHLSLGRWTSSCRKPVATGRAKPAWELQIRIPNLRHLHTSLMKPQLKTSCQCILPQIPFEWMDLRPAPSTGFSGARISGTISMFGRNAES